VTATNDNSRRIPTADTAIDPSKLYRSDDLSARMGWRPSGWRAARRAGLKAYRYGKRWFVRGADAIAFVQEHGNDDA
jgi:hypothetical protein